jgi:hypothetical protein
MWNKNDNELHRKEHLMKPGKLIPVFLGTALAGTPAALMAEVSQDPVLVAPIHAPGTLIVQGTYPEPLPGRPNTLQFEVDATDKAMAYMGANRIGLIPQGQSDAGFKLCPYFNYDRSRYSIEQDHSKPGRVLKITAEVTSQQIKAVQAARCLVTDKPPIGDIKKLSWF